MNETARLVAVFFILTLTYTRGSFVFKTAGKRSMFVKQKKCLVKKLQSDGPATSTSFLFFDFNVGNPERAHHTLSGS